MLEQGDERYLTTDGKVKTPKSLSFILVFLLRGYLAWIVSLTFSQDRSRLLQFFYASTEQFALTLVVGLPALIVWAWSLRLQSKAELAGWWLRAPRAAPLLLWTALILDGWLLLSIVSSHWPSFSMIKAGLIFAWCCSVWLLLHSRHLKRYWVLLCQQSENNQNGN
ncbi:DUF2919 family protein [Pseudidiomarina taiwanensis]|uniref:DUF2919 domain-containing protein n=1 Tax=Pseudidiomarina taiwanensis TaxID=337250 RepID=A0A432ZNW6_9GAMM|nr:DUF2919 family protein [Pseudidiomarina taiwanensis]RUO79551.1 DUF2919 domain-containing protein [Pseudidiomarina taiwanensis]